MRTLYFDCFAGASGNMILGALIAAGVDTHELKAELNKLNLPDFELEIEKVDRSGISSIHVEVRIPDEKTHRHLPEIEKIINESGLSDLAKSRSLAIFSSLAQAEANVHGTGVEKVHFHEVGSFDAIIDIVGSCIGFEMLGIEHFSCSKVHVGSGFVEIAHGKFPVPPPAVVKLLKGVPFYSTEIEGELITPTGAAIISTLCSGYGAIPEMTLEITGYGAGTREYDRFPNVLRLMIGESAVASGNGKTEAISLLETNIDDLSPQLIGHFMDRAFAEGALDCWFSSIQMKKNRPATLVSVLCRPIEEQKFLGLFYHETSTIGVRVRRVERHSLERKVSRVATEFGEIAVKTAYVRDKALNRQPEFEDLKAAAAAHDVPVKQVANAVARAGDSKTDLINNY